MPGGGPAAAGLGGVSRGFGESTGGGIGGGGLSGVLSGGGSSGGGGRGLSGGGGLRGMPYAPTPWAPEAEEAADGIAAPHGDSTATGGDDRKPQAEAAAHGGAAAEESCPQAAWNEDAEAVAAGCAAE